MQNKCKRTITKFNWLAILIVPVLLIACGTPNVEWNLVISGEVASTTTFTFDDLAEMDLIDLNEILMERSHGEDEIRSFSGVPLEELLTSVGVSGTFNTITAIAADGYAIEISKGEMVDGIVALKQGGKWIAKVDPDEGPIRLVFPNTPADRWVFQVTEIVVNP